MNEDKDTSTFSFEANVDLTSPIGLDKAKNDKSLPSINDDHNNSGSKDTSIGPFSFHTALDSDISTSTPSKMAPVSTEISRQSSPNILLNLQTSTPSKAVGNGSDILSDCSSRADFSFLNTSGAHESVFVKPINTPTPKNGQAPRQSPHSRNSSISWSVQVPEEWTMERVQLWLELYKFNETWANTFRKHNLCGEAFLKLTSYQNLKRFKDELSTIDDSTQSRFIHLLRKTLDKSSSITTLSVGSPQSPGSSLSSLASVNSSPDIPAAVIRTRNRSSSDTNSAMLNRLTATVSTPNFDQSRDGTRPQSASVAQRPNILSSKKRPVSTIESSSKIGWPASPAPVTVSSSHSMFRRQHKKSSSSESSLFTTLFSSSNSYLPQTTEEKRQSLSSREGESRGLLSKFRKKTEKPRKRTETRTKGHESSSPISPNSSGNDRHSMLSLSSHDHPTSSKHHAQSSIASGISNEIPFVIQRRFQPVPQNKNSDKYILATSDNVNFRPVNIGTVTDKDQFRKVLTDSIVPNSLSITIHLTDFGCSVGEALDDHTLQQIIQNRFDACSGKFLISSSDTLSTINSTSDVQSVDSKEGKFYPNTPQHYYDTLSSKSPAPVDYWNFKEIHESAPTTFIPLSSSTVNPVFDPLHAHSLSSQGSLISQVPLQTKSNSSTLSRKKPLEISAESTFRVIRPSEKGEINFDKRRESPYARPSLVAKRSAPPPPKKPLQIKTDAKAALGPLLEPVKEVPSTEGTYVAPYTPGSSNTLIPEPYKGSNSVSPISRKALDLTMDASNDELTRNRTTSISRVTTSKFRENFISFENAPELDDESDDENGSDEDFWAKAPSESKSNPSTMSEMIVRPAPEVLYDNLEKFFPDADLDRPVIDVSTPPTSPSNEKIIQQQTTNANNHQTIPPKLKRVISSSSRDLDSLRKPQRMKTIRAVAKEASEARKRESIRRNTISSQRQANKLVRRQSTKMWGRKVVEVKPNQRQFISKLRKDRNGEINEFSWIKGELIGKGTFGNVYIALNVTTGEMIAVKQVQLPRFPQKNSRVADVIEALRSEVDTLKDLDHLNIVQYLGFEETEREYNLFLEYVAGGSVASCLRLHGRFEEPLIKFLTSQVLSGLAYLHSRGILHRDMKADNLLLDLDGVCKISDFGISKKSNDIYENDAGMSMQGTIFWMAPEVVDSHGAGYSAKVDIWSVGCVVLEMFAGRRPWSNLEAIPAMLKIGKAKAAPPIPEDTLPHVSMIGRGFLDSCFTTDPRQRPTAERLENNAFCAVDPNFSFAETRLANLIKANEKKVTV